MAGKRQMVTVVFRNRLDAERAFDILHTMGYTESEINVLMSEKTRATYYSGEDKDRFETSSAVGEGAAIGGAVGTAVGATLAAVAAIGTSLLVPGLGIIVAGPVVAALAGGGAGAVAGGLVGGLVGMGISESNAKAYEAVLRQGGVVIGVEPRSSNDLDAIKKSFQDLHGENIYVCSC
ncbi:MAG TPA: hypothetical protein VE988_25040 [Gemmataceae bacterium]|nr:hypothetical protein [Gemmataceae bacterium]